MAQQHFMSFSDLESSGLLSSKGNIVQYCIQVGILQQKQNCLSCRSDMILVETDARADGFCWSCQDCPTQQISIRRDSILQGKKLSLLKFLKVMWHSCNTLSIGQIAREENLSPKTVRNIVSSIRHCMIEDLLIDPTLLVVQARLLRLTNPSLDGESTTGDARWRENGFLVGRSGAARSASWLNATTITGITTC